MRQLIYSSFLLLLFSCTGRSGQQAVDTSSSDNQNQVSLQCESISQSEDEPRFAVYALIEDYKVKLAEINGCDQIDPENYADYQIPSDAVAAAGGWWAGSGDYFYARVEEQKVHIYRGVMDESMEDLTEFGYREIAFFENGKFKLLE